MYVCMYAHVYKHMHVCSYVLLYDETLLTGKVLTNRLIVDFHELQIYLAVGFIRKRKQVEKRKS